MENSKKYFIVVTTHQTHVVEANSEEHLQYADVAKNEYMGDHVLMCIPVEATGSEVKTTGARLAPEFKDFIGQLKVNKELSLNIS
jgi:hypothetical protein